MVAKRIAIIPARAGSTRIPGKNTRPFFGRPIIEYTIDAAHQAGMFDEVVITSDDPEVLDIAARTDCTPLKRPAELADGATIIAAVIAHVLEQPDYAAVEEFCLLLATAPMRTAEDIVAAHGLLAARQAAAVVGVRALGNEFFHAFWENDQGYYERVMGHVSLRSGQFYPKVYADNGSVYWCLAAPFKAAGSVYCDPVTIYPMPGFRSVDIDTMEDWELAEYYYRKHFLKNDDGR
jgi:pseudaminic acid cytidylyltransferase